MQNEEVFYCAYDAPEKLLESPENRIEFLQWKIEFLRTKHARDSVVAHYWNNENVLFTFSETTELIMTHRPELAVPVIILLSFVEWNIKSERSYYRELYGKEDYKSGVAYKWVTSMKDHIMAQNDSVKMRNNKIINSNSEKRSYIKVYNTT